MCNKPVTPGNYYNGLTGIYLDILAGLAWEIAILPVVHGMSAQLAAHLG